MILQIVAVVLFAQYLGVLEATDDGTSVASQTEKALNDFIYSVYKQCCTNNRAFCPGYLPADAGYCYPVYPVDGCPDASTDTSGTLACFSAKETAAVGNEVCITLQSSGLIGVVTDASSKACGGGSPLAFRSSL